MFAQKCNIIPQCCKEKHQFNEWNTLSPELLELMGIRTCRVGSVNFSQWKIGHAHDNSTDSENVAGAPQRSVHRHFIFRFENGPGNQSFFFYPRPKSS